LTQAAAERYLAKVTAFRC